MRVVSSRPNRIPSQRRAFTLIELLMSIVIIGIISSMLATAITGANRQAKTKRAEALIERLNLLILQIYEQETEMTVGAPSSTPQPLAGFPGPNALASKSRAIAVLNWKRDHLRCALPDRRGDLIDAPIDVYFSLHRGPSAIVEVRTARVDPIYDPPTPPAAWGLPTWSTVYTFSTRWQNQLRYRQRVFQMVAATATNPANTPADFDDCVDGNPNNGEWTAEYQSAECLYMIMATSMVNGIPASDSLRQRDIGDLDEDGVLEVLDPWGVPLGFLRWPCGHPLTLQWDTAPTTTELVARKIELGKDPIDILYSDPRYDDTTTANYQADDPFPLLPLIVSAGNDGFFDMIGLDELEPPASPIRYVLGTFPIVPTNVLPFAGTPNFIDPYQYTTSVDQQLGARSDTVDLRTDNSADNVFPAFENL